MRYSKSKSCCSNPDDRSPAFQFIHAIKHRESLDIDLWNKGRRLLLRNFSRIGAGPEAEDLAHEAFLRLWRDADTLLLDHPSALLRRVCTSVLVDLIRRRRNYKPEEASEALERLESIESRQGFDPGVTVVDSEWQTLMRRHVASVLHSMDPRHRQVIRRRIAGEASAEIAESMDPEHFEQLRSVATPERQHPLQEAVHRQLKAFRNRPNVIWSRFVKRVRQSVRHRRFIDGEPMPTFSLEDLRLKP